MNGTGGQQNRTTTTVDGDVYLTPRWAWEWFFKRFEPLQGSVVVDPCCAGFDGWTAGAAWATSAGHERVRLSDIDPQATTCALTGAHIQRLGVIEAARTVDPAIACSMITNPPYNLAVDLLNAWRPVADEIVLLVRQGFLAARKGNRLQGLHSYWQPQKRLAFELLPREGRRRLEHNAREIAEAKASGRAPSLLDVVADPRVPTGFRMSSTGVDHGFAVWKRGYTGPVAYVIEPVDDAAEDGQGALFKPKRRSTAQVLRWG